MPPNKSGKATMNVINVDEKTAMKKKKIKRKESYAIYIYKVLKYVHPNIGISSKGTNINILHVYLS